MSGIIKAVDAATVRLFNPTAIGDRPMEPATPTPERSATELALDEARNEIARLQTQLLATDKARHDERDEAYAAGVKEGRENAADDAERRLVRLQDTADAALDAWRDRIGGLDALAAMLARGVIAKVFSPHGDLADLVARAISAKIGYLRAESVVAIRVSGKDFADPSAVVAAGAAGIEIIVDPALASGECRIGLRLGEVDLAVDRLAQEVDDFLRSLGDVA